MKTYDLLLGGDHRGLKLKEDILGYVSPDDNDEEPTKFDISLIHNLKPHDAKKSVDYPDVVKEFGHYFDIYSHGILICGSGFGVCIAANRFKHIRAATCRTVKEVEIARRHNNINVLCLGANYTKKGLAFKMVKAFFETEFEGGRHRRRVTKLGKIC